MPNSLAPIGGRPSLATKGYVDDVTASLTGGGQPILAPTAKNSAYTAAPRDLVLADASGGAFTVTLPPASGGGMLEVKKVDSSANVVTVAAQGSDTVGSLGAASVPIRLPDQAMVLQANGTNWMIVDGYQSLSSLDARYTAATTVSAPPWAASTAYRAGELVWQAGGLYRRITAGTSGASFDPAQWTLIGPSSGGSGGGQAALGVTVPAPIVGGWYVMAAGSVTNPTRPNGEMVLGPQFLPPGEYDQVGLTVVSPGSTGSIIRVVAYTDDTSKPGTLIGEATVDATTSGFKSFAVPISSPTAGRIVWIGMASQGNPTTRPSTWEVNSSVIPSAYPSGTTPALQVNNNVSWLAAGQTGAAPTTGTAFSVSWGHPRMAFRRSA